MNRRDRLRRGLALPAVVLSLAVTTGCDTVLHGFVGPRPGEKKVVEVPPPPPPATFEQGTIESLDPSLGTHDPLPPTPGEFAPAREADPIPVQSAPRRAIAAASLSPEPATLGGLGAAAAREPKDARFVLLVLTPPPDNQAAISRNDQNSRAAAHAALDALGAAGIAADHVEVSAATALVTAPGELRLYVR